GRWPWTCCLRVSPGRRERANRAWKRMGAHTPLARQIPAGRGVFRYDRSSGVLYGGDNRVEVFCQEAGAANEPAIDVFDIEDLAGVLRLERAAVENANGFAAFAEPVDQAGTDGVVHGGDVFKARGAAGADGPDGLV